MKEAARLRPLLGIIVMRRVIKYVLYAVAGFISFYALVVVAVVAYLAIGETMIPGFKLADHVSKDQGCTVDPLPKGCPGNLAGKSN
jgi:hypothetical protein